VTRLLDLYDPTYKRMDDALSDKLTALSDEIHGLPRWRWLRRSTLRYRFEQTQRKMGVLREVADADVRDRLLRRASGLGVPSS
jgi:hypothetical protein